MTQEEAQKLMQARFTEYPDFGAIANSTSFKTKLSEILAFQELGIEFLPTIENEVKVVLALYAPISELGVNISETTSIPTEKATHVATLIKALILEPVENELLAFDLLWHQQTAIPDANIESKERLQLRPDAKDPTRPLTREEVMSALGGKRTMAQDIEAARLKHEANKTPGTGAPPHS
jgi:hypothetical protein